MSTLSGALQRTARQYGERPAVIDAEGGFTWRQFADRVARLASVLQLRGTRRGTHFGVLAVNSFRQAELFHAAYWLGAVPVPVNTRLAPTEIRELLAATGCAWVAVDPACASLLQAPELTDWQAGSLLLGGDSLEAAIAAASPAPRADIADSDAALLLHTGGTAGRAKCVVLSHRNILANALQVAFAWPPREDDIALHVAPMFHSADLVMTAMMLRGSAQCWLPRFTPADFLRTVEAYRVTVTMVVPTMLIMILQSGLIEQHDIHCLRRLLYGASPMSRAWFLRAVRALPNVEFTQGYGLTETAPLLTMLDWPSHLAALAAPGDSPPSCGRPLPGVDIRIVDDSGSGECGPDKAGEIIVRGPNVFGGHHRMPQADAHALRGGWFHTGDIGKFDDAGLLYILDRKKDMVNVGGEKVYSLEVEAVLMQHPAVAEVAVVAVQGRFGEAVFAVVVCQSGMSLTKKAMRLFCRGRLGAFKIPTGMVIVDALPKSALGKVLKSDLARAYSRAVLHDHE